MDGSTATHLQLLPAALGGAVVLCQAQRAHRHAAQAGVLQQQRELLVRHLPDPPQARQVRQVQWTAGARRAQQRAAQRHHLRSAARACWRCMHLTKQCERRHTSKPEHARFFQLSHQGPSSCAPASSHLNHLRVGRQLQRSLCRPVRAPAHHAQRGQPRQRARRQLAGGSRPPLPGLRRQAAQGPGIVDQVAVVEVQLREALGRPQRLEVLPGHLQPGHVQRGDERQELPRQGEPAVPGRVRAQGRVGRGVRQRERQAVGRPRGAQERAQRRRPGGFGAGEDAARELHVAALCVVLHHGSGEGVARAQQRGPPRAIGPMLHQLPQQDARQVCNHP